MHVYQMRSSVPAVVAASQERIRICMNAMKDVSRTWLVAKMVHTLFESILGNRHLEEKLQKAAGKKHQKMRTPGFAQPPQPGNDGMKRKFDDMSMGFSVGTPAPQMSYERSRPQSPAAGASQSAQASNIQSASPNVGRSSEHYLPGMGSRGNTRPGTPFNAGYSVPATPPDLFLVTRNSPNISQQLWENFQPDQLFPEGTGMSNAPFSPPGRNPVDPALQMTPQMSNMQNAAGIPGVNMPSQISPSESNTRNLSVSGMTPGMQGQNWPPVQSMDGMMAGDHHPQDDTWSNSSTGNPVVPTTLNVEDW